MHPTLEDGLRVLEEAAEQAPFIRIELDDEYLRAIALAEQLSGNRPGSDKTWVAQMDAAFRDHYRRVTRA